MRRAEALLGTWVALGASPGIALADEPPTAPPTVTTTEATPPLPPVTEARPPLPPEPEPAFVPWHNSIEVGGGFAVSEIVNHVDGAGAPTPIRFQPGLGFHIDASWQIIRYLRFTGYMSERNYGISFPAGSLIPAATPPIPAAVITPASAHAYSFGARFSPTLPLGARVRLWVTAGGGWGTIQYPRLTFNPVKTSPTQVPYVARERSDFAFEVPVGLGGLIEIIPRWLSLHVEATATFMPSQSGDALTTSQVINAGAIQNLPPMPSVDVYFLQTIGLSVHL
jgi:hypothetical protein